MSNQPENDTSEKETKADKPKRRWYQYSLRSLMIVMTVLCVWLGYISNEARNQKAAVAWVEEVGGKGGRFSYDFNFDEDNKWIRIAEPPGPDWLREWIGIDYFCDVVLVSLYGSEVDNLSTLSYLTNLKVLDLFGTQVTRQEVQKLRKALPSLKIN